MTNLSTDKKTIVLSLCYPDTPPPTGYGFKSIKYNQRRNCSLKGDRSDLRLLCSLCAYFVDINKISFVGSVKYFRVFAGWSFSF